MSLSSTALPSQRKKGDTRQSAFDGAGSSNEELPPSQTSSELPCSCASHGCTSFDERGPSLGRKQSHSLTSEREADFLRRRNFDHVLSLFFFTTTLAAFLRFGAKMATSRMIPLARHLQLRLPSSWLSGRSISTSQTLVPPQSSTSTAEADPAAIPSAQDKRTAPSSSSVGTSSSSAQRQLPYFITRTERNRALPVYSNIRAGGTRQEIQIRHVSGNLHVGLAIITGLDPDIL